MNVETQPGYILLSEEIDSAALDVQIKADELAVAQASLDQEQNVTLPANETRLAAWKAAGNSDMANKNAKIAESQNSLNATKARIAALKNDIKEIGYELTKARNLLRSLNAQRDAFSRAYRTAIMNNDNPEKASRDAEKAAERLQSDVDAARAGDKLWYKKPIAIIGGVVVLGLIIYLIVKLTKK